jgi:hypothetical protein
MKKMTWNCINPRMPKIQQWPHITSVQQKPVLHGMTNTFEMSPYSKKIFLSNLVKLFDILISVKPIWQMNKPEVETTLQPLTTG